MAIKLNEVFNSSEVANHLMTTYNAFFTNTKQQITAQDAALITALIQNRIALLLNLDTIYETIAEGKERLNLYFDSNILLLVKEIKNSIASFDKEVAVQHHTTNFNPIDNDAIDDMPYQSDDKTFSFGDMMLGHIDFLLHNSRILDNLYWLIRRDCETILD